MGTENFLFYPELEDESFYRDIYSKKEFRKNKMDSSYYNQTLEDLCGSSSKIIQEKILQPHQEFLRNYISNETPYNGILLFHGVGTGKCISAETLVYVNGLLVPICELWENYSNKIIQTEDKSEWATSSMPLIINAYDEKSGRIIEQPVKHLYRQKVSEKLVVLELINGQFVKLTHQHHLLTENGWSNDFVHNKYVAIPRIIKNTNNIKSEYIANPRVIKRVIERVIKRVIKNTNTTNNTNNTNNTNTNKTNNTNNTNNTNTNKTNNTNNTDNTNTNKTTTNNINNTNNTNKTNTNNTNKTNTNNTNNTNNTDNTNTNKTNNKMENDNHKTFFICPIKMYGDTDTLIGTEDTIKEDLIYLMGWYISSKIIHHKPVKKRYIKKGYIKKDYFIIKGKTELLTTVEQCVYNVCQAYNYQVETQPIEGYLKIYSPELETLLSICICSNQVDLEETNNRNLRNIENLQKENKINQSYDDIPDRIMTAPLSEIKIFLQGYFDAEAYISIRNRVIRLHATSDIFVTKLHQLLKLFGVNMWVNTDYDDYKCIIKHQDLDTFRNEIGFYSNSKAERLEMICSPNKSYNDNDNDNDIDNDSDNDSDNDNDSDINKNKDIQFIKIKNVTLEDYDDWVYDLEVDTYHNYVAGGILCHNTCAAISIAEALKPRLKALGKKVYILVPSQTKPNFKKEIYDFVAEREEKLAGFEPGSYQCTGPTYYIPEKEGVDSTRRHAQIERQAYGAKSIYEFYGQSTSFPSFVEYKVRKPDELFADSVIIIDEAHNITSNKKVDTGEEAEEKKIYGERGPQPNKNVIQTLTDLFTGYHAFKSVWLTNNSDIKKQLNGLRNQLESKSKKASKETINKTLMKEADIKATKVWISLDPAERKKWQTFAPKNIKLILMTASPMENTPLELVELLNLLRLNDRRSPINPEELFHDLDGSIPIQDKVNKSYLCKVAKGYISYVRGQNPITFPAVYDPAEDMLYNPGYVNPSNPELPIPLFSMVEEKQMKGTDMKLRLVKIPMSPLQYSIHQDWVIKAKNKNTPQHARQLKLGTPGVQISNMIFPVGSPLSATYGNTGFASVFKLIKREKVQIGITKKTGAPITRQPVVQYAYQGKTLGLEGLRAFIRNDAADIIGDTKRLEGPINGEPFGLLERYSPKFNQLITNMQDSTKWGINFAYSNYVSAGALALAIVLELNGYVKFRLPPNDKVLFYEPGADGKYVPNTYDTILDESIYTDPKLQLKRRYRCCKCARLDIDPIHTDTLERNPLAHKFRQGTYILFTGGKETQRAEENKAINQTANKYGDYIKIVLGSEVSGEGVNLYNVREVHIIDPWHHNTKIYQAIGRAIRHCSHKGLPADQRNVTVYKYSATVPELIKNQRNWLHQIMKNERMQLGSMVNTFTNEYTDIAKQTQTRTPDLINYITLTDLITETTDEMIYFRVLRKDVIIKYTERILKEIAVDCAFFKTINVFPQSEFPAEIDGSRLCDYLPCNYQCIWGCGPPVSYWDPDIDYPINTDTYNRFFSNVQVDRVVRYIQRIFNQNWSLNLSDIINLVHKKDPTIELEYIYQALDKMLQPARDQPIVLDRYRREGHLIYMGKYYIVQPNDFIRNDMPTYYRRMPIKVTAKARNIERLKSIEAITNETHELDVSDLNKLITGDAATGTVGLIAIANNPDVDKGIAGVEWRLDRLSPEALQYLFERVYTHYHNTTLANIFVEYLRKRRLLLESPTMFGHYIRTPRQYIGPGEPGTTFPATTGTTGTTATTGTTGTTATSTATTATTGTTATTVTTATTAITGTGIAETTASRPGAIIGVFIDAPAKKVSEADNQLKIEDSTREPEILYDPNDDFDVEYKYYGYYDDDDGTFKLVDLGTERTKYTKDNKISLKTHAPGRNCINFHKPQLENVAETLSKVPVLLKAQERQNLVKPGNKSDFCGRIENALRLLNERDRGNRRWFLYPNENKCIEYSMDGKHLLVRDPEIKGLRTCVPVKVVKKKITKD